MCVIYTYIHVVSVEVYTRMFIYMCVYVQLRAYDSSPVAHLVCNHAGVLSGNTVKGEGYW